MTFTPINPMSTTPEPTANPDVLHAATPMPVSTPTRRHHEPYMRIQWIDDVTGATGYLVIDTMVQGMATGGTRMRAGCTVTEVEDLARGMSNKTAAFDLPIGGAKGGVDFDPKDPRAVDVLTRFYEAMRPYLDRHWVTAEDLGVPQSLVDTVFARLGMNQSYHAAIERSDDPRASTQASMRRPRAARSATSSAATEWRRPVSPHPRCAAGTSPTPPSPSRVSARWAAAPPSTCTRRA